MKARDLRSYILIILFLIMIFVFSSISPQFRTLRNLMSMFRQISFIGIMAVGATFVMLSGGIDLSVGSTLALAGIICARLFQQFELNAFFAVIITLMAGYLMGFINGKAVTRFQIPPFIVTLGTMGIFRGLALFIAPRQYGFVYNIAITNKTFLTLGRGKVIGIYNPIIFFFLIAILLAFFLNRSKFGTYVYAVGSNEQSALMSGIYIHKIKTSVYIISGICSSFAGILWTSRLMTTTTEMGIGNELDVIAAIVVGGTSIYGGRGGIIQTIIGTLFIGILSNGLFMLGLPEFYQPLAKSLVIISAASLDYFLFMKKKDWNDNLEILKPKGVKIGLKNYNFKSSNLKIQPTTVFVEVEKINKSFGDNKVLKDVSLKIKKGEVHALIGENGAGKSTLIKILTGVYKKDSGKIKINGENVEINNPKQAQRVGIGTIFQEFSLIPTLNIARNILLGREPTNKFFSSFINSKKLFLYAQEVLNRLKFDIPLKKNIEDLSIANKQMVEIAKAFSIDTSLLIMDEPTASLSIGEKYKLFESIQRLLERGTSIFFISHILEEILEIANTVSILRDGQLVCSSPIKNLNKQKIIQYMVGHKLVEEKKSLHVIKKPILSVNKLSCRKKFSDVSFTLHEGEILGLTGLVGAGRSEIARAIFGLELINSGEIYLNEKCVNIRSPLVAMKNDIAFISKDRKKEGLVLIHSMINNLTMANLKGISNKQGIINKKTETQIASKSMSNLDIRPPKLDILVLELSGGNQQKVILGKWLSRKPKILIVDEPTVGIDIGAKHEIYNMLKGLAKEGVAILFVSSDFTEVLRICSRIMVMRKGKIVSIYSQYKASQKKLMEDALG